MSHFLRSPFQSLGTRLLVFLLSTVGLVLAAYAVVSYRSTREQILALVADNAHRTSQVIHRATHSAMLLNEKDDVARAIREISRGPGAVESILVYDKVGRVVFSSFDSQARSRTRMDEDPCSVCHGADQRRESVPRDVELVLGSLDGGDELLRHVDVIDNEPGCAGSGCHADPETSAVLGILEVRMSMEPVQRSLRLAQHQVLATTLVLMGVLALVVGFFVNRMVQRPVALLAAGTRRIAEGDLDTPLAVRGHHELSRLARDFNRMTQELRTARSEIVEWSQTLENKVVAKTEELRRAQRQVLHMEKMASLGKLSATVAHELNNPIGGILTYAKLVDRGLQRSELPRKEELRRHLQLIQKECLRCGDIVKNLLVFARRSGSEMEPVDLPDVVDRSLRLVRHHLEISGIESEVRIELADPVVQADGGQIEQMLVALMINAVEAMQEEGGTLTVTVGEVGGRVEIVVADSGNGIDPEVLPHIFEPFFSTKQAESGVGLGLAVVFGIVRRHGGEVDVDSEVGKGTRFRILLPRTPPQEIEQEGPSA